MSLDKIYNVIIDLINDSKNKVPQITFNKNDRLTSIIAVEYNEDLYNLILNNILVGKDNYNYDKMFAMVLDYASWNQISWEQFDILVGLMDMQHNPPVEDEVIEEIPNEIM